MWKEVQLALKKIRQRNRGRRQITRGPVEENWARNNEVPTA